MNSPEIHSFLSRTLDDLRLSRNERQALAKVFDELGNVDERTHLCHQAFALAREHMGDSGGLEILDWLEEVVRASRARDQTASRADFVEACFSPGFDCARRIMHLFDTARRKVDVCVFTITDNRISDAIYAAHERGVAIRIVTDNEKIGDEGSDIERLESVGIPVRVDRTEYHMHHKFAIFDESHVLTGSFNWTRGAAERNEENFIITSDPRLIRPFEERFELLWEKLA